MDLNDCAPYQHVDGSISAIGPDMTATLYQDRWQMWSCRMTYKDELVEVHRQLSTEAAFNAAWRKHVS